MIALVAITAFAVQVSRRAATEVANIAALNVLENGAEFNFTGEALVVYQNGNYVYVKDDTGSTLIYKKDVVAANSIGKTIEANWTGKVSIYNKLFEVVPDAETLTLKEGDPVTVTYPEATIADVTVANVNKIVKLTDVTIASVSGKDFKIKKGDVTVAGYNQFAVEGLASGLVCTEMVGAISVYNDAIQFQPISYTVGTPAPDPVDVVISPETGADISAALSDATATAPVKSVTINLAKDGAYTLTSTIKAPAVTINGNGATIDASAGDNIVGIEGVTEFAKKEDGTDSDHSFVKAVTFKDVTITGMKKALIRDLMTKTLLETLTIENCVMQASDAKPFIDFDGRGYVGKVVVKNSTIWAAAGTNKNFAKYGSRPKNVNEALTQEFDIQNSTIVNIAPKADFSGGQNFNNLKQNGTAQNVYTVKNNIFVNCGKSGQVIVGLNNGQTSATPVWDVDGNAFNWNDADVSATEVSKAGKHKVGEEDVDIVQNSVEGVVAFKDAANGDFTLGDCAQYTKGTGDPRWIVKVAKDITIAPESGDIAAALTAAETDLAYNEVPGNITINLTENVTYTVGATMVAPNSITINGNGAIIDASALEANVIEWKTKATEDTEWTNANVSISGVTVKGLKKALFYSNSKNYYGDFSLINSVVEQAGDATTFDYTKGSVAVNFTVSGSTIYAPTATTKSLYSSQSAQKATEAPDVTTQTFTFYLNTMYNLAKGKNFFTHRQNSQKWLTFGAQSNIFVNCGKSGQTIKGLNGGGSSANPTWAIDGNVFNFDGADTSANEQTGDADHTQDEVPGLNETVQNSVAGVITFTDATTGDFNGNCQLAPDVTVPTAAVGDPRWTIMYKESPIKTIWKSAEAVALSWGTGVDVEKANTDIIQVGDVIHVAVEGVTASDNAWSAQVALYDQQWAQLENGTPVGTGTVTDAAIVVTGDMLALIKANGLKIAGDGYSTKQVTVERGVYMGSEKSIWVGDATLTWTQASATKFHFINTNVTAGQIIKLTYEATGNPNIQFRYGWGSEDVYGEPTYGEGFATVAVSAEAVDILKDKGLIINADGIRLTQMELLPAPPVDIEISPAEGDIAAALKAETDKVAKVGKITINLTKDVTYTVGATMVAPNSITINGNGATIDASALEANLIEFAAKAAEDTEWTNADVAITAVTVKGLKKALFYSNSKYYYGNFTLINSFIEQAADATTFDYTKGSVALNFTIAGSTIYAPTATTKSLYSSQSGQKATEYNADATQNFVISVNTMYNLAKGKNFFTHRQSNQKWLSYTVQSNLFVNCGKSGQVIKGMNGGASGANPTWVISGNAFNFDGADTSAAEATGDDEEPVKESVAGVMTFANVETPDFGGTFEMPAGATAPTALGDIRWTITFTNAPAPKFYIIGLNGNWDRTNMIEMTRNESGRYEYEFTTETQAFFAFADKQMTAEEAEADQDWSVFNSYRYSLGDGDVEYTQLGEIKSLVKGAANGTITLKPGTFKITVEPDFNAVTITGEFAPEPQPVTVDKLFIMGTGTPKGWEGTTELTFNEATQAFEYEATVTEDTYLTFGDAEFTSWADFNGKHRFAPAEGNTDAVLDQAVQLVLVNDGCVVLKNAGTYKISVTKDLKMTITAAGTGINSIAADKMKNATIYTVSGQRVEKAQKGLYIIDGKKVVVK